MNSNLEAFVELRKETQIQGILEQQEIIDRGIAKMIKRFDIYKAVANDLAPFYPEAAREMLENIEAIEASSKYFAEKLIEKNTAKIRNTLS